MNTDSLALRILDREIAVTCPPDEQDRLRQAASLLDQRMREIKHSGKALGTERVAMLAALHLAHELVGLRNHEREFTDAVGIRIKALRARLDGVLEAVDQG